jgi:hypothetical protein
VVAVEEEEGMSSHMMLSERLSFASRANETPSFSYCLGKGHGSLGVVREATIDHAFSKTVASIRFTLA